jgi:CRP-like cAMP-binding protein
MTDSSMLEKAVDALVVLNAALTNIRLYPPTSAMIVKSIDNTDSILQGIFEQADSLVFVESEGNLIISGHILDENNRKRPQVASFIQLMLKLGIKNIVLKKGLAKSEILNFLQVAIGKPEDLRKEGGIQNVMSGKNIKNILLNQKPDEVMDKDSRIADEGDVKDSAATTTADKGQLLQIKSGIESIIKGEDSAFRDRLVMQALPKAVFDLMAHGKEKTADAIIHRLGAGLLNEKEGVRGEASLAFARIGANLLSEKRMVEMIKHSPGLVKWLRFETMLLPAYRHIANQMQLLSRYLILNHRLAETMEILKSFNMISTGEIKKDESIKSVSSSVLEGMARDDIFNSLVKDFQTDKNGLGLQALEILVMLGPNSTGVLLSLLEKLSGPGSSGDLEESVRFQEKICEGLGRIGSHKAVPALKAIVEQTEPVYNEKVKSAANNALEIILKINTEEDRPGLPEKKEVFPPIAEEKIETGKQAQVDDEYSSQMGLFDQLVKNKDTGSAAKLLFEMIVKYAKEKDFEKAENLRGKLMDVDPMALGDIIKSGEVIEEEKNRAIDQAHLKLWSGLYKNMTKEEISMLFFAMKSIRFNAGHTIFKKGDHDSRLYFINKGHIKLVFNQGDKEILVKELKPGDMLGEDAFFSLSLNTTTAITLSDVELNYLEKEILAKWDLKSYGIEPKLHDFYLQTKKINDPLGTRVQQQRTHERIAISGKVRVQFMDSSGTPAGEPVIGALSDISQGGMSFYLNIKKEKITKLFLEPRLNLKFNLIIGGIQQPFDQNGTMVAAIPHYYDYSIHVKFDNRLDKQVVEGAKRSGDSGEGDLDILMDS